MIESAYPASFRSNCAVGSPATGRPQGWRWRAPAFGG